MKLKVLASGSSGNCYVLETPTGSLLIEAGIPWKTIQKGLNFDLSNVLACLVSHEHKDHCKAIENVMNAGIDCYSSKGTLFALDLFGSYRAKGFVDEQLQIEDFIIKSFKAEHDAADPRGFLIQYRPTKEKLLFLTDSYYSKYRFKGLNYIMIECNYIKDTLDRNVEEGYIPEEMKKRLLKSHFSLENVKGFLKANDLSQCRKIILLHLSDANSDAKRMIDEIEALTGIDTVVADAGLEVELEQYPY